MCGFKSPGMKFKILVAISENNVVRLAAVYSVVNSFYLQARQGKELNRNEIYWIWSNMETTIHEAEPVLWDGYPNEY